MAGETQLKMVAAALGFTESASSVDVLTAAEKRLVEVTQQLNAAKLTGTVAEVAHLRDEQQILSEVVTDLAPKQEQLNARTQDYIGLLNQIHPALGQFAMGMTRGVKVAGELASANLTWGGTVKSVTDALKNNVAALGLLGAGGVAILGLNFLISQWNEVKKKIREAEEAQEKFTKAQTKIEQSQMAEADAVVEARDRDRRLKPFSKEQADAVERTIAAAPEDLRDELGPLLTEFGGGAQFGPGGGEFAATDLEKLARLGFKVDPSKSARVNAARAKRFLQKEAGDAAAIDERRSEEREALKAAAATEFADADSLEGAGHLETIAGPIAERFGLETDDLITAARKETSAAKTAQASGGRFSVEQIRRQRELDEQPASLQAGAQELARLVTIINNNNVRNIGPNGSAFQGRIVNPEFIAREAEVW